MENLKIKVNSEDESREAQELFFELGYRWIDIGATYYKTSPNFNYLTAYFKGKTLAQGHGFDAEKEITLPELRDRVVLKRNDVGDATHTDQDDWKWYISSNGDGYVWQCGNPQQITQWDKASLDMVDLKPIEKTTKEYLHKKPDGSYELIVSNGGCIDRDWIEIPGGAEIATKGVWKANFWKNQDREFYFNSRGEWSNNCGETLNQYLERNPKVEIVWQREQDEPFLTPESTLNDQHAEIEQVRQEVKTMRIDWPKPSAWDTQVGGNHYKQFKIQPMQFALENKLDAAQQNVIKYVMRHSFKNGKQDLEKAKHYIDLMIEFYYGDNNNG